jgi:hypothetical protein
MRATAAAVYGLDPTKHAKDLQLWSSHSLRVGAFVVLHAHGFTGPQIQFLLRWKLDAFMAYLRNLGFLAMQQNVALSDSAKPAITDLASSIAKRSLSFSFFFLSFSSFSFLIAHS